MRWIESNRIKKDIKDRSPNIITNQMLITSAMTIDSFRILMMKTMRLLTFIYQKMTLKFSLIIVVKVVGLILFRIKEKLKVITLNLNPLEEVEQKVLQI